MQLTASQSLAFNPLRDAIATGASLSGGGGGGGGIGAQIGAGTLFTGLFQTISLQDGSESTASTGGVNDDLGWIDLGNSGSVYDHVLAGEIGDDDDPDNTTAEVQTE